MNTNFFIMKFTIFYLLLLCIVAVHCTISNSFAVTYIIERLTYNTYYNGSPQINSNGYVVWVGRNENGDDGEIYFYDGTSIKQITSDNYTDSGAAINDYGRVVWKGLDAPSNTYREYDIFLYDGETTIQLTTNGLENTSPRINNNGQVAWRTIDWDAQYSKVFLYDGTTTFPLTTIDNSVTSLQMSDNRYVVWVGMNWVDATASVEYKILLYDGDTIKTITQINTGDLTGIFPQVNINGQVVWMVEEDSGETSNIFFYDGTTINQITSNIYRDFYPKINNNGQVVWEADNFGQDSEIFLYNGTTINQITSNNYKDSNPQINDNGQIVWLAYHGGQDSEIFLYDGTTTYQLTNNDHSDSQHQISNNGCVVWKGYMWEDGEIFRACPDVAPNILTVRPEHVEFPFWKSEDYWGYWDPRNPLPPHEIEFPEINPEPPPCPECSFSRNSYSVQMPTHVYSLYRVLNNISINDISQVPQKEVERIITLFKAIPTGQRYNDSMKNSVVKDLRRSRSKRITDHAISGKLLSAMNAIELDWRIPFPQPTKIKKGKDAMLDFQGIAWVTFYDNKRKEDFKHISEKVSFKVEGGVPALVKGYKPGWPTATYHVKLSGKLDDYVEISIYFGGQKFRGDLSSLRVLQWDGKAYKDITTVVDLPGKVIRGRTDRLSTFVIMSRIDDRNEKQQIAVK